MSLIFVLAQARGGSTPVVLAALIGALIAGLAVWFLVSMRSRASATAHRRTLDDEVDQARRRRDELIQGAEVEAQKKLLETMTRFERETAQIREELKNSEKRLAKREDGLDKKLDVLSTKERKIEQAFPEGEAGRNPGRTAQ